VHMFKCLSDSSSSNSSANSSNSAQKQQQKVADITALECSPALDVAAIGRSDGSLLLIHLRKDAVLFKLSQTTAVTCLRWVRRITFTYITEIY
jgi:hypothetical protein